MPSTVQQQLFTSAPRRTWRDLKPEFVRRRVALDLLVDAMRSRIPEAERRAAATHLALPFSLDPAFERSASERLLTQYCAFRRDGSGPAPVEQCLDELALEDDLVRAVRNARPALLRLGTSDLRNGVWYADVLTWEQGLLLDPRLDRTTSGSVVFCRLVPFLEYSVPLDLAVVPDAVEWSRIQQSIVELADRSGLEREKLPVVRSEEFEIAILRAYTGAEIEPCPSLLVREMIYRRGRAEDVRSGPTMWDEERVFETVSPALADAFDFEGIGFLDGTFGDPALGEPVEIDELEYVTEAGRGRIRVYNRGISLFTEEDPTMTRLHRFFSGIPGTGEEAAVNELPRALNWSSVGPLLDRNQAVMDRITNRLAHKVATNELLAAGRRLGIQPGDEPTDDEIACMLESLAFLGSELDESRLDEMLDAADVGSDEYLVLDALTYAWPSTWSVREVVRGHGLILEDPWMDTGETFVLAHDWASLVLEEGDLFYARLAVFDGYAMVTGPLLPMDAKAVRLLGDMIQDATLGPEEFADQCMAAWLAAERGRRPLRSASNRKVEAASSDKVPRNAPCPCGSGRKYKHCCRG